MKTTFGLFFLLIFSLSAVAQDYASQSFSKKVIGSFTQGDNGKFNRSAISLIKCAIATFGIKNVVKRTVAIPDNLLIILRNGDSVTLSNSELAFCKRRSGFRLIRDEDIFDEATLLYGIMAKRAINNLNSKFGTCHNLPEALAFLHNAKSNVNIIDLIPLLGFDFIQVKIYSEICYIHQNGDDAAFACYGIFDDEGLGKKLDTQHWSKYSISNKKRENFRVNLILANFIKDGYSSTVTRARAPMINCIESTSSGQTNIQSPLCISGW